MIDQIRLGLLAGALVLSLAGCEEKGPAERAGERMDEAIEDVQDSTEDMRDEAGEALDEAQREFDEAVE